MQSTKYANVTSTVALIVAMGGTAIAASRYVVTDLKQISPKAQRQIANRVEPLIERGATGATGPACTPPPQNVPGPGCYNPVPGPQGFPGERGPLGPPGPITKGERGPTGPTGPTG